MRAADLSCRLVRLDGRLRVLDLRSERTLDLLSLDDEISVSRRPAVLAAGRLLTERLLDWYGDSISGVVYRSRTTPTTSVNLAFFPTAPLSAADEGALGADAALLDALIVDDGFTIVRD